MEAIKTKKPHADINVRSFISTISATGWRSVSAVAPVALRPLLSKRLPLYKLVEVSYIMLDKLSRLI